MTSTPETPLTEQERRLLIRARKMLPLLYADLRGSTGKTRHGIEDEIDDLERELEDLGLAYDRKTQQVYALAEEDEEE